MYKPTGLFLILLPLFSFFGLQQIKAQERITGKEVEAFFTNEFNRGFYYYGELSSSGGMELYSRYTFRGGVSFGIAKGLTDIRGFTSAGFSPLLVKQLNFSLAWIYNGLPKYGAHSYTILPVVSFNGKWAGISLGTSFRFTSYFREHALFESVLSISGYVNFVNTETLVIGIGSANFDEFSARNMGAYSLSFKSSVRVHEHWFVINDLELMQSGSVALSATFYGVAWKSGMKIKW